MGNKKDLEWSELYGRYQIIDGEYYEFATKDGKAMLKHVTKKDIKKKEEDAEMMAGELVKEFNGKAVLVESIMQLVKRDFEKLKSIVQKKIGGKNTTVKTRRHHCVDMKIGGFILPIR